MRLLLLLFLAGCATKVGPKVKIYMSIPQKGGIYRLQEKELVKYEDTFGYFVMKPEDFKALLNWCGGK